MRLCLAKFEDYGDGVACILPFGHTGRHRDRAGTSRGERTIEVHWDDDGNWGAFDTQMIDLEREFDPLLDQR